MQKLRADRLAMSRHRPRPVAAATIDPPAKTKPLKAGPVSSVAPIMASRKVIAALAPAVVEAPADRVVDTKPSAPRKAKAKPVAAKRAPAAPAKKPATPAKTTAERKPGIEVAPVPKAPRGEPAAPKAAKPRKAKATAAAGAPDLMTAAAPADTIASEPTVDPIVASAAAEPPAVEPPTPKLADPSPLSVLPTLGPGMIWRLNQIGLESVGDLAEAAPDMLRDRLGAVSKLIRVETLIELARARVARRSA
ncbi:MAG: hypothetical protein ACRCTI_02520 [Beijerinckiaceae bacterium]